MKKYFEKWWNAQKERVKTWWKESVFREALNELDESYKVTMIVYDLTHSDHYDYSPDSAPMELEVIDLNNL